MTPLILTSGILTSSRFGLWCYLPGVLPVETFAALDCGVFASAGGL